MNKLYKKVPYKAREKSVGLFDHDLAVIENEVAAIRKTADDCLAGQGVDCVLEWNKGNHFKEPDIRTAKAFAWLIGN